jgi:hypothetical protein
VAGQPSESVPAQRKTGKRKVPDAVGDGDGEVCFNVTVWYITCIINPCYLAAQTAAPLPKGKKRKTVGEGEQEPKVSSISNAYIIRWTHPCVSGII